MIRRCGIQHLFRTLALVSGVFAVVVTTGCLQTREDLKGQEEVRRSQPINQSPNQQSSVSDAPPAVVSAPDSGDVQEMVRVLNGRVEVLEHELQTIKADKANEQVNVMAREQELQTKLALLTESVAKLEERMVPGVPAAVAAAGAEAAKNDSAAVADANKNPWLQAEEEFKNKNWRQSIVNYQKYRASQPNGKNYAGATYKIAVSFQELGLKQDAKAFFEEVISRFPNSEYAKRAQFRVKQMR